MALMILQVTRNTVSYQHQPSFEKSVNIAGKFIHMVSTGDTAILTREKLMD